MCHAGGVLFCCLHDDGLVGDVPDILGTEVQERRGQEKAREKEEHERELEHGLDGATLEPPRPQVGINANRCNHQIATKDRHIFRRNDEAGGAVPRLQSLHNDSSIIGMGGADLRKKDGGSSGHGSGGEGGLLGLGLSLTHHLLSRRRGDHTLHAHGTAGGGHLWERTAQTLRLHVGLNRRAQRNLAYHRGCHDATNLRMRGDSC
mmetsp:Transcript_27395/g.45834  ORF Transcript_27395/g.45834 Transcript_27395/m.45834 type:complete len:205 (-) Transcript_27395:32-646(-)